MEKCYYDCMECCHHYVDEKTKKCVCQYGHILSRRKPKKCISYEE